MSDIELHNRRKQLGALLLIGIWMALAVMAFATAETNPGLGLNFARDETDGAWRVSAVAPTSQSADAHIRPGDLVVEVEGGPPPDDLDALLSATQVTIVRADTTQQVSVGRLGTIPHTLNPTPSIVLSLLFLATGTISLVFGRGVASLALALCCNVGAITLVGLPLGSRQFLWAVVLNAVLVPLFMGSFAYLFLCFPVRHQIPLGPYRLRAEWILLPALPISLLYLISISQASAPTFTIVRITGSLYFLCCLLLGTTTLIAYWLHSRDTRAHVQHLIIIFGTAVPVLLFLALNLVPQLLGLTNLPALELTVLPFGLIPLSFGYAMLRYQIIDMHIYIRRGAAYSGIAATIGIAYALVLALVTMFLRDRFGLSNIVAVVAATIVFAFGGEQLRVRIQQYVDRLFDREGYNYRQRLLEFSEQINSINDPDRLARETVRLLNQTTGASHVRLYIYESGTAVYHLWSSSGLLPGPDDRQLSLDHPTVQVVRTAGGQVVQRFEQPPDAVTLFVPIQHKDHAVALLTLGPRQNELPYTSEDYALLRTIGNQLATATENAQLHGSMRDLYLSGIRTLAATVDAKDAYTHGHSERVATYSKAMALQLALSPQEVEKIEIAGLLHDIGKIGVPDAVLQKAGRLNPEERQQIEDHAELGAKILAGNRALLPVVQLVRHHHERYGGGGYPTGVAGDNIPLGSAIIAVADTYDTMTTDRPYRQALGHEAAYAEIFRCSGTQFSPQVVEAFGRAIQTDLWRETHRQAMQARGHGSTPVAGRLAETNARAAHVIYQMAQTLSEITELRSFVLRVIDLLRAELGMSDLDIYLIDPTTGVLNAQAGKVLPDDQHVYLELAPGQGVIGWTAEHQLPTRVIDNREDPRVLVIDEWMGRSEITVPLIVEGRTTGVIFALSPEVGAFSEYDEMLLVLVASQLAQAIEVARLHDELKRAATIDGLTGIANHRHFRKRLEESVRQAAAQDQPLSLIMIDVNGLKQVNDLHGHLVGDGALRMIATTLHNARQSADLVARYGGDEFAILLPGVTDQEAEDRAESYMQVLLAADGFSVRGHHYELPTIAVGVASLQAASNADDLIALADMQMYSRKYIRRSEASPNGGSQFGPISFPVTPSQEDSSSSKATKPRNVAAL